MNTNSYKIVLLDDDPQMGIILKAIIESKFGEQFLIESCTSSESLMSSLRSKRIDLFITDFNLPGESGLEVLKKIEATTKRRIPCLLLTGDISKETVNSAFDCGVEAIIHKPFEPAELFGCLSLIKDRLDYWQKKLREIPLSG